MERNNRALLIGAIFANAFVLPAFMMGKAPFVSLIGCMTVGIAVASATGWSLFSSLLVSYLVVALAFAVSLIGKLFADKRLRT